MATQTITIRVSPEAARVYNTATAEQQRKLEALLSLKLTEVARIARPLEDIMSDPSALRSSAVRCRVICCNQRPLLPAAREATGSGA